MRALWGHKNMIILTYFELLIICWIALLVGAVFGAAWKGIFSQPSEAELRQANDEHE